ncbi:MAG: zf-HC2 domain-containing protein [Candidatus Eisenbacteria sp.]|nr:zf-HC2 domain-containing protein [Candidatus Eisenbacteria bacterium]
MSETTHCVDPEKGTLLAAYELGLLAPSDQALFEKHLSSCPACQERLYGMSPFMSAVQSDPGRVAARLAANPELGIMGVALADGISLDTPIEPVESVRAGRVDGQTSTGSWLNRLLKPFSPAAGWHGAWRTLAPALAAAAVVAVVLWQQSGGPNLADLARLEAIDYVQMEIRADSGGKADLMYRHGMTLYAEGQYAKASRILSAAFREATDFRGTTVIGAEPPAAGARGAGSAGIRPEGVLPAGPEVESEEFGSLEAPPTQMAFYAGLSFLLAEQPDSAVTYLEMALSSSLPVLSDRARWYLAQAHLLRSDPSRAIEQLEALVESPGYGAQAAVQLNELREAIGE